jgi:uncharacterized membrane protein YccC
MARATFVDRLIAADPGFVRLFMAARATAAVGVTLGILLALRGWFHLPLTVPLIGAALGMTWTISVNDADRRNQQITTLMLWLPAAVCLAVAIFTSSNRVLGDVLFVAVLFLAIYVRKYGPRGAAIGTVSVLAFFFILFLRVSPRDFPWLLVAIGVVDLTTYLFRFTVFRDNPKLALRMALSSFRARQRLIAETIVAAKQRGGWTRALRRTLDHHVFRLNETALGVDDLLLNAEDRITLLEAELAAGEAAEHAVKDLDASTDGVEPLQLRANAPVRADWTPRGPFRAGTQIQTGRIAPTTRQAIQLSVAGALAILLGELLSPQRWYWAVLATFVIFLGTSSSGETRNKAWSRVAGTALGIAAGIVVTYPVRGHDTIGFLLLLACLFAAVYTVRLSYATMIFFLTIVLSLLYVLLGFFSDRLLLLRLEETALGAALGGVAATLLLPISTKRVLLNVSVEALRRLDEVVGSAVDRLGGNSNEDTVAAARRFDEALQSVRTQIEPLIAPMRVMRDDVFRTRLIMISACGYYTRALVAMAYEPRDDCPTEALRREREAIHADVEAIVAYNEGASELGLSHGAGSPPAADSRALTYLHRIDRALHGFAQTLRSDEF